MAEEIIVADNVQIQRNAEFNIPRGFICTIDTSTMEGKMLVAQAINAAISMKDKEDGETLRVVHVITTPGERSVSKEPCTNTYLITDDGEIFFSQSDGIASTVKVIVAMGVDSRGQYHNLVEQGVGMQLTIVKLDNGRTLKKLIPVSI